MGLIEKGFFFKVRELFYVSMTRQCHCLKKNVMHDKHPI